jgi:hypothetical protein
VAGVRQDLIKSPKLQNRKAEEKKISLITPKYKISTHKGEVSVQIAE